MHIFLFTLSTVLTFSTSFNTYRAHAFHVSVTEMSYNERTQRVEWVQQVFLDDLEKTLQQFSKNPSLDITYPKNKQTCDSLIESYYRQKVDLRVNNKLVSLNYLGHEVKEGSLVSYLETTHKIRKPIRQIFVRNTLLFESFQTQKNLVYLTIYDFKKTLRLTSSHSEEKVLIP